ncbi:hypothetical protein AWB65_02211 [Caballeronia humi]|uniref:Uncharacterized protein n=1 Tax=Caballeronia humi TaxID=326474 RepID=A0A158GNV4_9BURK|nr:hypothetical protein AWB65_02211 [Caballeronia humi]
MLIDYTLPSITHSLLGDVLWCIVATAKGSTGTPLEYKA